MCRDGGHPLSPDGGLFSMSYLKELLGKYCSHFILSLSKRQFVLSDRCLPDKNLTIDSAVCSNLRVLTQYKSLFLPICGLVVD